MRSRRPSVIVYRAYQQPVAFGDLSSDGVDDVAFILDFELAGSSIIYELATLVSYEGESISTSTIYLDDRAQINDLQIKSGIIILDLYVHAPDDVHCCPTQHEIWQLKLTGGKLTPLP